MTNKEAFKKICKNLNSYEFTDEFKQAKNQIIRDLEVLQILKKHFLFQLDDDTRTGFDEKQFNGIDIDDICENGDYKGLKKIKEWLNA